MSEKGSQITAEGADLSQQLAKAEAIKIDESYPGWKGADIHKMQTMAEIQGQQAEVLGQARDALASEFHEEWRKTRLDDAGNYEPREKKTTDESWIESHGTDTVDIANTTYEDLPSDWQAENKAAADVVVGLMVERGGKIDLEDDATRSEVGDVIHQAWLDRNPWAADGELGASFDELPAEEQAKDIAQVETALKVFGE